MQTIKADKKLTKPTKVYVYDYPEQRELCKGIITGDASYLQGIVGYSAGAISLMISGKRKMAKPVRNAIVKLMEKRAEFEKAVNEPETETVVSEQ